MATTEENTSLSASASDPPAASTEQAVAPTWSVDSIMGKCRCWGKWWFTTIVIFSWILLVGLLGLGVFCSVQWKSSDNEYINAKSENDKILNEWKTVNETVKNLGTEIDQKTSELNSEKSNLQKLKDQYNTMSDTYHKLEEQFGRVKNSLDAVIKERDTLKEENNKLKDKNTQTQEKIRTLTNEVNTLKKEIQTSEQESKVFKTATAGIGAVLAAGAIDSIISYTSLSTVTSNIAKLEHYRAGFPKLAEAFENYELLKWKNSKSVTRKTCFQGTNKNDLSNCVDKAPTITTITTADGYKFGAVFYEPWKTTIGTYSDAKAYTFSDTVVATSTINDPSHAMIVNLDKLIEFGEGDIAIELSGTKGNSIQKTYTLPSPYTNTTFYYNGTSYAVGSITIDAISIQ